MTEEIEFTCRKCGEKKPASEFFRNKNNPTGYWTACKRCSTITPEQADAICPATLVCIYCGVEQPRGNFSRSAVALKTGRNSGCKGCVDERRIARQKANPEKTREQQRRAREKQGPHIWRKYYDAQTPEQREHKKAYNRQWQRADYAKDPQKYLSRPKNMDSVRDGRHRRRALEASAPSIPFSPALLQEKWAYWGGLCWMCGGEACEWDHVKPLSKGGMHCLANLRPACRSCNASKNSAWPLAREQEDAA